MAHASGYMPHENMAEFIRHLLIDLQALEYMISQNLIEDNVTRIGAEQEFCLVSDNWRPTKKAEDILQIIDDYHFTCELAKYNLEINVDPLVLERDCFRKMEDQLSTLLEKAKRIAKKLDTKIVLTGILPTISKTELELDYIYPSPRYRIFNQRLKALRGTDFTLHLRGVDELSIHHESVLFEACNTSFQLHLQISPSDFISSYNWAQAISGPVLSIATNSPLLLGRELWSETRIALFQQSIDTRHSSYALKDQIPRVSFGTKWSSGSIASIFKQDIAQHKALIATVPETDSMTELQHGKIPELTSLNLYNSSIYRWNRPCYGAKNGRAHVRIENRYLPAGPTLADEMANFAFWVGLMMGRPKGFDDMPLMMDFRDAKANFIKAARTGKESVLYWMDKQISARDLVTQELLPIAFQGLKKTNTNNEDIKHLLGIIEKRAIGKTGAQWQVRNYRKLRDNMKRDDALLALTKAIYKNQKKNKPVHEWPMLKSKPLVHEAATMVLHIMSTQLFTVNEDDLANLATSVMQWMNIHHLPVVDTKGNLCGLLTWTHMKRFHEKEGRADERTVADIMTKKVITATPKTDIREAIRTMKENVFGCLPVVEGTELVGIITIQDVIPF